VKDLQAKFLCPHRIFPNATEFFRYHRFVQLQQINTLFAPVFNKPGFQLLPHAVGNQIMQ